MGLPLVMHVEFEGDVDLFHRKSRLRNDAASLAACGDHALIEGSNIKSVKHHVECRDLIVPDISNYTAKRGGYARIAGHQRCLQANITDQRTNMQRTTAAKRHCGKPRRIMAALDRDEPDCPGHPGICNANDCFRCCLCTKTEWLADMFSNGSARWQWTVF